MKKQSSNKNKSKLQIVNKSALIRLVVLLVILLSLGIWVWVTMFAMPEKSYQGQLPPLKSEEIAIQKLLETDLQKLAVDIGIRNFSQYKKLNQAENFLETELTKIGYQVKRQEYKIDDKSYYNIEAELKGINKPDEIVVIGGHYDSAYTSPGANDNGTGAVATLELARIFANQKTNRTIRFVEFTNEEPPYFWTEDMGSLVYAKQSKQRDDKVVAMLSLETMGYFSDQEGSQTYPFNVGSLYPNRGNFIAFIGNLQSGDLVKKAVSSFRRHTQFPSEGIALPDTVPGVGWSDQWSFWQQGYKGIMVTDTAFFRYKHYHTEEDTIDKIDFEKLARVVNGLAKVIADLAE